MRRRTRVSQHFELYTKMLAENVLIVAPGQASSTC